MNVAGCPSGWYGDGSPSTARPNHASYTNSRWRRVSTVDHSSATRAYRTSSGSPRTRASVGSQTSSTTSSAARAPATSVGRRATRSG